MASTSHQQGTTENEVGNGRKVEIEEAFDPYTVFTLAEKYTIIVMVSYISWSANLSTFIFLPALKPLSESFDVSVGKINLVITVYMAVGSVMPLFVGDAADVLGRRTAYIVTLSVFAAANLCLALANSYGKFLGLRMLQATGQSGKKSLNSCRQPALVWYKILTSWQG